MAYLLGIDVGTSGTKTVLFDETGLSVASSVAEYPMYQPFNGWAEQDPADWWKAACQTIKDVLSKSGADPSDIAGVGLTGQMHGMVLLDAEDKVLRRSIIWCDQRTSYECAQIESIIGRERLVEITACPALTAFTASKVMWVRNNEPQLFEKVRKILVPKDYIRFKLTGEYASEVSDASGMQLLDVPKRKWSGEVISKLGLSEDMLGDLYESSEISGSVTAAAAEATGLRKGTPVAGGAGDQPAAGVGNGVVKTGIVSSTIGTSGVLFACTDSPAPDPAGRMQSFCHAVPGKWHIMGVTYGAGMSLKWFRDLFCIEEKRTAESMMVDPYVLMDREAEKSTPGSGGIVYLPYLIGERTPHLDPDARGVFFGLSIKHEKRDMIRSVMEGVIYGLNDGLSLMRKAGVNVSEIRASGGGGRSSLWRQMQADIFNTDITTVNSSEGSALGAALLAAVGTGIYGSVPEACDATLEMTTRQHPDKRLHEKYMEYYKIYTGLYESLKHHFKDLAVIQKNDREIS